MHNNKLGCLTTTGIFAILITLFVIVGVAFASGSQMFTAGDLNAELGQSYGGVNSHAQIAECNACHTAPWETEKMADRCAACHTDIAAQMFDVAKLHGMITQKSPTLVCRACHPEHRGPSAPLTDLSGNTFPHEALGFKLEGKHASVKCGQCHVNNVWKSTPTDCYSCHKQNDKHNGQFGTDCSACHNPSGWKDATFDHNRSGFKLEGKHASVKCEQCHVNNVFKGTPSDCFSCHQKDDEHNGQFGTDCSACHNPNSWGDATFDHNKAAFKLDGAHAQVRCEQCHQNGVFKGTPSTCISCHADPAFHAGAFGADCASCHNTSSWNQARFNLAHPEPSSGGEGGSGITHGGATCRQCHPSTVQQATCTACHDSNNPGGGGND